MAHWHSPAYNVQLHIYAIPAYTIYSSSYIITSLVNKFLYFFLVCYIIKQSLHSIQCFALGTPDFNDYPKSSAVLHIQSIFCFQLMSAFNAVYFHSISPCHIFHNITANASAGLSGSAQSLHYLPCF